MSVWQSLVDAFQDYEDEQREKDKIVPEDQRCYKETPTSSITFNLDESLHAGTVLVAKDVWDVLKKEAEHGRRSEDYFSTERRRRRLLNHG